MALGWSTRGLVSTAACALAALAVAAPAAHAAGDLVAAYGFDEGFGSAVGDASGSGNAGTTASTTWAAGKYGQALSFPGTAGAYVTVPDGASLRLSGGMTLEAWVNPAALGTTSDSWRTIVFKQTSNGMAYALYANNGGARPTGQVNIGGEQDAVGTAQLPLNAWTHLATTYDGATLRLYVDGVQVASKAQTGSTAAGTGPLRIGGNSIWGEAFRGLIDEVRVYNRALTAAQVQADMARPVTAAADTQPPAVQIAGPAAGSTVTGTVAISATASDDRGVAGVQFQLDGTALGAEDTTAPYGAGWDTTTASAGSHQLTAVARDAAGNRTASAPVAVSVRNAAPSFVNDRVIVGLNEPTDLAFTPDGRMLIAQRDGTVRVVQPGATRVDPAPFLQLPSVSTDNERGLLGLALDPSFSANGYVYVFYTRGTLRNRVSRFTATGNAAALASETVIWENPAGSDIWHQGGGLAFAPDGNLFISVGDHLQSQNAQSLTSYAGKILRIARDGSAPSDNPFYDGSGPNLDAIWARGLRNPFRIAVDPPTGRMMIADVGQDAVEELDLGARGANYGWPTCEGSCSAAGMTNPVHSYRHDGHDASVTGGFFYRGSQFPAEYQGSYFFGDYAQNWIRRLTFDGAGAVAGVMSFEPPDGALDGPYGDIVALAGGPDGSLWYVDAGPFQSPNAGSIRRIRNVSANQPPIAEASADVASGPAPLTVRLSSGASRDPEQQRLAYRWDFGDGQASSEAHPTHTYARSGRYVARLTVSDGTLSTSSDPVTITVGSPPVATILAPTDGLRFKAGDAIAFAGEASDPDDGRLPASALSWKVVFHHDSHIHPVLEAAGASGTIQIPDSGHSFHGTTSYQLVLTATDSDGISTSTAITIVPTKVVLGFATAPAGLTVNLDGIPQTAPFSYDELAGFRHTVDAPSPQFVGGDRYEFAGWSDGGARSHVVTAADRTLTATFSLVRAAPPGLVAAYGFGEGNGGTLYDASGHGHDGTLSGPVWAGSGHSGGALSFDGVNDYVLIPDHDALDLTTAMTLEAWVRPSALGGSWRTVVFKEQPTHMAYALYAATSTGPPTGQVYTGGERDARTTSALPLNAWTHLATTYDGATVRLYVNGVEVRSLAATGPIAVSGGPLKLGGNAVWAEWYAGLMDDVRVYNRALSASEIQGDMSVPAG